MDPKVDYKVNPGETPYFIVLYSEIVETAYSFAKSILEFIIAHELGHIKRNHMMKNLLCVPSQPHKKSGRTYRREHCTGLRRTRSGDRGKRDGSHEIYAQVTDN